ncbi:MAG TPA: hydantoinase/carbamoylase family amidase [Pseudolabrys sp.]|nr:hydantoinase/carbamoylase family amidase [Pseudolabrys sp.]
MPINAERLLGDLRALAQIGKFETGVNRPALSRDDMAARAWTRDRLREIGHEADIDGIGNVYGRMKGVDRAVLVGSHTDTVPRGGWLDGALGVVYAIEIARCIAESGVKGTGVDVVNFQDEEGTFLGFVGSCLFCGEDVSREIAAARNKDGTALTRAIADAGLSGRVTPQFDPKRHRAYFEAHIEQGPRLEKSRVDIGAVTAIVGIKTFRLKFRGESNHAGTTPMDMRRDAGAAAMRFGVEAGERIRAQGSAELVWNIGSLRLEPGVANIVPSLAELVVQVRDVSADVLAKMEPIIRDTARECAERYKAAVDIEPMLDMKPAVMAPALVDLIRKSADDLGASSVALPSGAGHDAQVMSRHVPSVMLFVPSIGGRSHHISENTSDADIVRGAQVLLRTVERFIAQG